MCQPTPLCTNKIQQGHSRCFKSKDTAFFHSGKRVNTFYDKKLSTHGAGADSQIVLLVAALKILKKLYSKFFIVPLRSH